MTAGTDEPLFILSFDQRGSFERGLMGIAGPAERRRTPPDRRAQEARLPRLRGYVRFAIGRTIWREALTEHLAGRLDRPAVIDRVAHNYREMSDTYGAAAAAGYPWTSA